MNKGDILYWVRVLPNIGSVEIYDLIVRTIEDTWFVAYDKDDKHAHLFSYKDLNVIVFQNREDALVIAKDIEKRTIKRDLETEYEEY